MIFHLYVSLSYGINDFKFYIVDKLKVTDTQAPYQWTWTAPSFSKHDIKAVAYDTTGKSTSTYIVAWKYF